MSKQSTTKSSSGNTKTASNKSPVNSKNSATTTNTKSGSKAMPKASGKGK